MAETDYIVLRRTAVTTTGTSTVGNWNWRVESQDVPASSAAAAIRLACKHDDSPGGVYVAVPARSWKPVTVKAETTTILKIDPT